MYVCICRKVTDHQIRDAVCQGACSIKRVSRELGVATQCGKCGRCAKQLVDETVNELGSIHPGAATAA